MVTQQNVEEPPAELTLEEEVAKSSLEATEATERALASWGEETAEPVESESPDGTEDAGPPKEEEAPSEPASSDELTTAKEEIVRLNKESAERKVEAETQLADAHVRQYVTKYAQQLVASGEYTEEQAQVRAESERRLYMAEHQLGIERKSNLARELSQEHGVPVAELMVAESTDEMNRIAAQKGPENKRVSTLEKEVADMKKARIPAQPYNRTAARTSATNESRALDQYIAGSQTPEALAAGKRAALGH